RGTTRSWLGSRLTSCRGFDCKSLVELRKKETGGCGMQSTKLRARSLTSVYTTQLGESSLVGTKNKNKNAALTKTLFSFQQVGSRSVLRNYVSIMAWSLLR
ncbi:hypothetical protein GG26_08565, partial [Synechococcus sp. 'PEA 65AY6A-5F PE A']